MFFTAQEGLLAHVAGRECDPTDMDFIAAPDGSFEILAMLTNLAMLEPLGQAVKTSVQLSPPALSTITAGGKLSSNSTLLSR